jgi:hypothetical protein
MPLLAFRHKGLLREIEHLALLRGFRRRLLIVVAPAPALEQPRRQRALGWLDRRL